MRYRRFAAMITVSTAIMYLLMYLNTYTWSDVWFSQTRLWMALIMGSVMTFVMMVFMWSMYENRAVNAVILMGATLLFCAALVLVRSQSTVGDISFMKAMIPHHSIAILTSSRAEITDPRVRDLADRIIEAQVKEIGEMERLIGDLRENPPTSNHRLDPAAFEH